MDSGIYTNSQLEKEINKIMNDSPKYRIASEFYIANWNFKELQEFLMLKTSLSIIDRTLIENAFLDIKNGFKEVTEFTSCLNLANEIRKYERNRESENSSQKI